MRLSAPVPQTAPESEASSESVKWLCYDIVSFRLPVEMWGKHPVGANHNLRWAVTADASCRDRRARIRRRGLGLTRGEGDRIPDQDALRISRQTVGGIREAT
jgi:hypothetical protein